MARRCIQETVIYVIYLFCFFLWVCEPFVKWSCKILVKMVYLSSSLLHFLQLFDFVALRRFIRENVWKRSKRVYWSCKNQSIKRKRFPIIFLLFSYLYNIQLSRINFYQRFSPCLFIIGSPANSFLQGSRAPFSAASSQELLSKAKPKGGTLVRSPSKESINSMGSFGSESSFFGGGQSKFAEVIWFSIGEKNLLPNFLHLLQTMFLVIRSRYIEL